MSLSNFDTELDNACMPADMWTTIAAFTAAGLSVVNVAATGILNNRVQLSQWRRSKEIEIYGEFMQGVNHYLEGCQELASAMDDALPMSDNEEEHWNKYRLKADGARAKMGNGFETVMQKLAELEVVASHAVVISAQDVAVALRSAIYPLRPGGPSDKMQQYHRIAEEVGGKLERFTRATRIEIGTESRMNLRRRKFRRSAERIYEV